MLNCVSGRIDTHRRDRPLSHITYTDETRQRVFGGPEQIASFGLFSL